MKNIESTKQTKNAIGLLEDTKVVKDNIDHLLAIFEMIPMDREDALLNVHVNPHTGALLDSIYEDNNGFIVRKKKGIYKIELECELSERARQNISNSLYEFTDKYL
jgi:hypothetical protein